MQIVKIAYLANLLIGLSFSQKTELTPIITNSNSTKPTIPTELDQT